MKQSGLSEHSEHRSRNQGTRWA